MTACGVKNSFSDDGAVTHESRAQTESDAQSQTSEIVIDDNTVEDIAIGEPKPTIVEDADKEALTAEDINVDIDKNKSIEIDLNADNARTDLIYTVELESDQGAISSISENGRKFLYTPPMDYVGSIKISYRVSKDTAEKQAELIIRVKDAVQQDVKSYCENLPTKNIQKILSFPARKDYNWGKNGNLSRLNLYFRAQAIQSKKVDLEQGALLCNLDVQAKEKFVYDDHFLFAINNNILASSNESLICSDDKACLEKDKNSLFTWDFDIMKNINLFSSREKIYCFGSNLENSSNCVIPSTERQGLLQINLGDDASVILGEKFKKSSSLDFSMILTGDNDSGDCMHSGVEMNVDIQYVIP